MRSEMAVARSIPQRLGSGWVPPLTTLCYCALGLQAMLGPRFGDEHFRYAGLSGTAFLAGLLSFHLKQVVQDSTDRLLPGGPRRPLLVGGIVLAIYLCLMPLLVHALRPASLLSQTAVVWLVAGSVVQFTVRANWISGLVPAGLYIVSLVGRPPLHQQIAALVETPSVAWSLIVFSCAWLASSAWQLAHMTEESCGYQRIPQRTGWWKSAESTADSAVWSSPDKAWWLRVMAPASQRIEQIAQRANSGGLWARVARWRCVNQRRHTTWVALLLIGGLQVWTIRSFSPGTAAGPTAFMPMIMMITMALAFTGMSFSQQRQYGSTDLLKPISREHYFREMGLSLAVEFAGGVAMVVVLTLLLVALFAHENLLATSLSQVLLMLLLIACGAVFSFGCVVWCLRHRLLVLVGIMVPSALIAPTLLVPSAGSVAVGIAVALALAALGLLITFDAYRRWLRTDIG